MRSWAAVCVLHVAFFATSVEGLQCNEGFNLSISGIPAYHWKQRTCAANSDCFGQEIMVRMPLGTVNFDVVMRYGSCISSAYKNYLDCNKLFGKDSTQDPAALLDLIPEIVDRFNDTIEAFATNILMELKTLFSNGQGASEFVDGYYAMMTNFGFNLEKALPLKPYITKIVDNIFSSWSPSNATMTAITEFYNAVGNLDTANAQHTNALKKLTAAINPSFDFDTLPTLKAVVEKGPGLIRSILNAEWKPELWYDVAFNLMGDINYSNWTKTAEDMVKTIKSSYNMPQEVLDILNPTFDAIPDLVKYSQNNSAYIGIWSLELLKKYSTVDASTAVLSDSLINFIQGLTGITLQKEYKTTIQYMPGLLYKFFPNNKADIQKVYNKTAEGFNSYDFINKTNTAAATKLSDFIISFVPKATNITLTDLQKAIVINTASTIYGVLSDYATYLDTFAEVMSEGFAKYPTFNAGTIVTKLITRMGGTVPDELKPLLANAQDVLDAVIKTSSNPNSLINAYDAIINAYKVAYPTSPFPKLAEQYLNLIKTMVTNFGKDYTMEFVYWGIDLLFAVVNTTDTANNELNKFLIKVFPEYEIQLKMMRLMKAEDVKELVKNIVGWASKNDKSTENFVEAIKPAVQKITASITSLLRQIRTFHAPESCKFGTCSEDFCNSHAYIEERPAVTKAEEATTVMATSVESTTEEMASTTSSGKLKSYDTLLNIATMWMACKILFG